MANKNYFCILLLSFKYNRWSIINAAIEIYFFLFLGFLFLVVEVSCYPVPHFLAFISSLHVFNTLILQIKFSVFL